MGDKEIGFVELTATTRIVFSVGSWKGQARASIRKFVATERYTGPTKSGMSLDGPTLVQLFAAICALQSTVPTHDQNQFVSVCKTSNWEIRIGIIPPDEESRLPQVDIREFIDTPRYTGPTKAGVRFPWNTLKQFVQLTEVLIQQLGAAASSERPCFQICNPNGLPTPRSHTVQPKRRGFDGANLKPFPRRFPA